jgi:hypothetical protein
MSKKNEDKYLYWFSAKDESGKDRKFCILKPNRKMKEDGELFYASKLSQFISAGILPKIVWDKVFKDSGGIISEIDQKEYSDLFIEFSEFKNLLNDLSTKPELERSQEEKEKVSFYESQIVRVRKKMQELEMTQVSAFENTAEAKARNRTIVWWAANLGVEEDSVTGASQLLGSGSIEEKLDIYDAIVENDKFLSDCFSRLNYLVTVWFLGSASTFEEFESLDSEYIKRIQEEESLEVENTLEKNALPDKPQEENNEQPPQAD